MVNGECQCLDKYYRFNNSCIICAKKQAFNPATGICEVNCGANSSYQPFTNECVCNAGYDKIWGTCGKCQNGLVYNATLSCCTGPKFVCKDN